MFSARGLPAIYAVLLNGSLILDQNQVNSHELFGGRKNVVLGTGARGLRIHFLVPGTCSKGPFPSGWELGTKAQANHSLSGKASYYPFLPASG